MLKHAVMVLLVIAPHAAVYVKGHSKAAVATRRHLEARTCFVLADRPEESSATLDVDHIFNRHGDSAVIMVLVDPKGKVLWESKAAEDPLPLRSPVNRLLKRLEKSTCESPGLVALADPYLVSGK